MAEPVEDDLLLTAFLDNELSQEERGALAARLLSEQKLRARLEELRAGGAALRVGLAAALGEAPAANMAARLAANTRRRPRWLETWPQAAAIAAVAFAVGFAAARLPPQGSPEPESWRESVAEYMSLYTAASFPPQDEAALRGELGALSQSVGLDLSEAKLRHGGFAPRGGVLLQFHGAPLAEIGYVIDGEPAAFCIIRNGEPDAAPARARLGDFNAVSWAKAGRGFMVVSAAPADRLDDLARALHVQAFAD